jgi:hypothetical protein
MHFDKANEFIDFIRSSNKFWSGNVRSWIFRGQRDSCWNLIPSVLGNDTVVVEINNPTLNFVRFRIDTAFANQQTDTMATLKTP